MQTSNTQAAASGDIGEFLDALIRVRRVHAKSLISTFFGDMVVPNDGYAWVETIFAALELLGVNDRTVRTTLFRLREEGWVAATRSGRKSYYRLTEHGDSQTRLAERRIYYRDTPAWDGSWTLVFLVVQSLDAELRRALEQELGWLGFGPVTKYVWARPGGQIEHVSEQAQRLGLSGKVIAMRCQNIHDAELGLHINDRELAAMCTPINEVESIYRQFIRNFSPLIDKHGLLLMRGSSAEMLSLRLLMMDEYRRATLRDPHLPIELLPAGWAGHEAFALCGKIYAQTYRAANQHYRQLQKQAGKVELRTSEGSSNSASKTNYAARFSGTENSS